MKSRVKLWATAVVGALAAAAIVMLSIDDGSERVAQADEFPRAELVIETANGGLTLDVEVARSPAQRSQGLMFRTKLAPMSGMLFLFDGDRSASMWMRNTLISLDTSARQALESKL